MTTNKKNAQDARRRPSQQRGPTPIEQVLRCTRLLREGWHDKAALAARLDVSERSIKRYLKTISLELDGFEYREVDERGQREYRLRDPRYVDRRRGSPYEVLALGIAQRFFRAFDPGGVADLLDQMLFEVTGEEEDADEGDVDRSRRSLARRFVLAREPQPLPGDVRLVFDQILKALVDRRVLELRYQPRRGPPKDYVVRPYTLILGEQEIAVTGPIGEPPDDGVARPDDPFRTFSLSRIQHIGLRTTRFNMPHLGLWDPEKEYASSWGLWTGPSEPVQLEVHPDFAELVQRRRWHPTQTVGERTPGGWIPVHFDVFAGGEFRTWVLGWGPWVRVLGPPHLVEWVAKMRGLESGVGTPEEDEVFRIT
jgi:predicted DNA-binding transcriptional regulator YafY